MAEGVKAGSVWYGVEIRRSELQAVQAQAKKLGKELDDAINKPAKRSGGGGAKALNDLQVQAKEAAAELRRLQDEEKSGTITRQQYAQSVEKLRGEMRTMVSEVDRGSKEYDTLTSAIGRSTTALNRIDSDSISALSRETFALRNQLESGIVSEGAFRDRMKEIIQTSRMMTASLVENGGAVARQSQDYKNASNAAGGAERALAALDGRVTKLGMSKQILIGGTQVLTNRLQSLGPAGELAAGAMQIMNTHGDQLADMFGVKLPGAMRNSLKVISTLQILAPIALVGATVALARFANQAADTADEIEKGATATGLSVEAYQELGFALSQSGVGLDQFRQGLGDLNTRLGQALAGNETYAQNFRRLGVALREANGEARTTEEVFTDAIDALSGLPSTAEQVAAAGQLFGEEFSRRVVPALQDGVEGLQALREEARELGLVISGDAVLSLVEYKDQMAALTQQFQTARIEIIAAFLPVLKDVVIPLIQDTVVPLIQNWADGLKDVGDRFVDTGAAGVVFRASIADQVTPLVQFVNLVRAAGAGLNLLDIRFQLVGRRISDFLGTGDIAWQRALEQFMGTHPLLQNIDVPDLSGWAEALGGDSADADQLRQWADEYDALLQGYLTNVRTAGTDVDAALAEFVRLVTEGQEAGTRALAGLTPPGAGEPGAPGTPAVPGMQDDPLAPARLWVGRLTSEVQFGMKTAGEAIGLLTPRAQELEAELRSLHEEGQYGSDAWEDAAGKLEVLRNAMDSLAFLDVDDRPTLLSEDELQRIRDGVRESARLASEAAREAADAWATEMGRRDQAAAEFHHAELRRIEAEAEARLDAWGPQAREIAQRDQAAAEFHYGEVKRIEALGEADRRQAEQRDQAMAEFLHGEQRRAEERIALSWDVEEAEREARDQAAAEFVHAEEKRREAAWQSALEMGRAAELEAANRDHAMQEFYDNEKARREQAAREALARTGYSHSAASSDEHGAVGQATSVLDEYGASLDRAGIHAALFGETHELSARQAELTRQAIERLVPILGDEHETVQDLIDAWQGYVAAAEEAEKETATLADHFENAEAVLSSIGGAAGGTLGDVIGGFGEVAGIARDIASGQYLTAATSVITEIVGAITAVGDAGRAAREELADLQADLNLINLDALTITQRAKVGQFLFIPIYADLEVLPEEVQELAQTIQSGMASGFQKARDIIVAGGTMRDAREAIRQGLREAVLDGILQGFLQSQAMQILFADEMARIIDLTLAGHSDAAAAAMANLDDEIDAATDLLTNTLESWVEEPIEVKIKPTFVMPDTVLTKMAPTALATSVADSLASGVESGLSSGVRAYLESGNLADLEGGLEEGIFGSVTDALVKALVEEGIVKGALGRYLPMIGQAFAAGDTDRAIAISQRMMDLIPGLAAQLGAILDPLRGLMPGDDTTPGSTPSNNGGIQVQEITGPTRDMFLDLFSPLKALDSVPGILSRTYDLLAARLPGPATGGTAGVANPSIVFEAGAIQVTTTSSVATSGTLGDDLADSFARGLRARGL